jgi:exopolyphosphatase / guanosine-5'-triphosphate,3'-diphosphate pyrophosphatase
MSRRMVCACVDIGTNTTRVLVAEVEGGRLAERVQRRAFTRIGKGMTAAGEIPPAKLAEVAGVVAEQLALAAAHGAAGVRVVATAAIRSCANRDEFVAAVPGEVEVLDGEQEARLAFLGATRTLGRRLDGTIGVVDVGGGSTELAIGTYDGGVSWWSSYGVGSGSIADDHLTTDPPARDELAAARGHASKVLAHTPVPRPDCAVAVGGSAASLRAVVGEVLEPGTLERAMQMLSSGPAAAVAHRYGLDAERVRLLPAGILILDAASQVLGQPLQIGHGGLREGVLLDMARTL